ncbi:MAG: hypothetical protein HQM14_20575 [SAR324 cluster bacterium]|nr:hypothetical protein [SAR324 cluster bacterium]
MAQKKDPKDKLEYFKKLVKSAEEHAKSMNFTQFANKYISDLEKFEESSIRSIHKLRSDLLDAYAELGVIPHKFLKGKGVKKPLVEKVKVVYKGTVKRCDIPQFCFEKLHLNEEDYIHFDVSKKDKVILTKATVDQLLVNDLITIIKVTCETDYELTVIFSDGSARTLNFKEAIETTDNPELKKYKGEGFKAFDTTEQFVNWKDFSKSVDELYKGNTAIKL